MTKKKTEPEPTAADQLEQLAADRRALAEPSAGSADPVG